MSLSAHPLWLVGFRPFFSLACLSGLSLPVIWAFVFSGTISLENSPVSPLQWHAHEMFFGFGWAVLGGFLLTSTKNWVNIRGYHGKALMLLATAWLVERVGMAWGGNWPPLLFRFSNNLFLGLIIAMLVWTLVRHRKTDSYPDNTFFMVILPAFLVAKTLLLDAATFAAGWTITLALFRMAFLVMLERTLTPFMKGAFQVTLLRHPVLDRSIKLLALTLVLEPLMPPFLAAAMALLAAILLFLRFCLWKPQLALTRIDIGIMYLGYLAIAAQLVLDAWANLAPPPWVGSLPVHVFTFGAMGLVIPSMIIRISKGHTGRKVVFETADKAALWIMLAAFAARIAGPQFYPGAYDQWIRLAAACWFACFALLAWRYIPFLVQPRVDGKEH